jgi:hypothetical protein
MGRRSLLTPELQDRIVRVVKAGNYLNTAAQYCGIGESTLKLWLQRGRAALALRDRHDPGGLYCPTCDTERTEEVQEVHRLNLEADDRPLGPGETRSYATLDPCPSCHSDDPPAMWALDPAEVPYLDFLAAITQAQTSAEVAAVTHWRAAFADDWRAARDFLVRKNPQAWAATTRVQISQDEAERRIEAATDAVLGAVGIDTEQMEGALLAADDDPASLDLDSDDEWGDEDGDA